MKQTIALFLFFMVVVCSLPVEASDHSITLFDKNPDHLWNETYSVLFKDDIRKKQKRLLENNEDYQTAVQLLDRMIKENDLVNKQSLLERVVMQRVAWEMFDAFSINSKENNAAENQKAIRALRFRLAKLILLTALSDEEIETLKSNYATIAFNDSSDEKISLANNLDPPADLFDEKGEWIQLSYKQIKRIGVTHEEKHGLRSEYSLFLRFPEGRKSGIEFLELKNKYSAWLAEKRLIIRGIMHQRSNFPPAPENPELPIGTKVILLERMLVVNQYGNIKPTPLIRSIEINQLISSKELMEIYRVEKRFHQSRWKNAVFTVSFEKLLNKNSKSTFLRLKEKEPFEGVMRLETGLRECHRCHSQPNLITLNGGGLLTSELLRTSSLEVQIVKNGTHTSTPIMKEWRADFSRLKGILDSLIESQQLDSDLN